MKTMTRVFLKGLIMLFFINCTKTKEPIRGEKNKFEILQENCRYDTIMNQENNKINTPDVYDIFVDFPGGQDSLKRFVYGNLAIPEDVKKHNLRGRVFVTLKINEDGKVIHASIMNPLTDSTKKEILRIIKKLPDFAPAQRDGRPVVSYYSLFINVDGGDNNK